MLQTSFLCKKRHIDAATTENVIFWCNEGHFVCNERHLTATNAIFMQRHSYETNAIFDAKNAIFMQRTPFLTQQTLFYDKYFKILQKYTLYYYDCTKLKAFADDEINLMQIIFLSLKR